MMFPATALLLLGILALTTAAEAQTPSRAHAEAAERFDRALRLVNAGDLSGGLAEFQRAHALSASTVVLYNIGLVFAALHRPVDAVRALDRALESPFELSAANVARARQVRAEQREIIGFVELWTNVKEGVVELDNVEVAKLPLRGPLEVASGPRIIGVIAPGYAPSRREILVAGKETARARLELVTIEGLLAQIALACKVPASDVFVDGERIGKTPLGATISVTPGAHRVEVRRAGYLSASRVVTLQGGSRAELALTPEIDRAALALEGGSVVVEASETQSVVSVDGTALGLVRGSIRLPRGPHRLLLERGGFLPAERDLELAAGRITTLSVVFEPTPETRASYVASAEARRTASLITLGAGIVLASAGAGLALYEQRKLPSAERALEAVRAEFVPGSGGACDTMSRELSGEDEARCQANGRNAAARVDRVRTLRTVGWVTGGAGALIAVTGLVMWLTGDDPHRYDEKPSSGGFAGVRVTPELGIGSAYLSAKRTF